MGSGTDPAAGAPSRLGRYQILGEIGRGGMGVVYRALDPTIGRTVAIKTVLVSGQGSEEQALARRARLLRESQAAGQLSHPNIVAVHDVGEQGDTTYIVMEFIVGQTLEQSMAASPRPRSAAESIRILADCARALDYAHSKGVVHRDVKPGNIILQSDGVVKVADFGIAKVLESSSLTQTTGVIGSPHFMAPEQLKGEAVSGRTDQYALAVVAYALLAGRLPFDADSMATLVTKTLYQDPLPALSVNPAVDMPGDSVLRKALAKQPEGRYGSCSEFVAALAAALEPGSASLAATVAMPPLAIPTQTPLPAPPAPVTAAPAPLAPAPAPAPRPKSKRRWRVLAVIVVILGARGIYMENQKRSAKAEREFWNSIQDSKSPALYEAYLTQYPEGRFAGQAQARVEALKNPPASEPAREAPAPASPSQPAAPETPKPSAVAAVASPALAATPKPATTPTAAMPKAAAAATQTASSQPPSPNCKAEFTTIEVGKFQPCLDYWSSKGYSPLTFAAAKEKDGTITLTGAFQASGANKITLLAPAEKRLQDMAEFRRQNYRPDSVNVLRSPEGARFTTIWTPAEGPYDARGALDQAEFDHRLQLHDSDGLSIVDIAVFGPKDSLRFHAVWSRTGVPARALLNLSAQDLRQKSGELQPEGYAVSRVSSYRTGDGLRYTAILEKGQPESAYYVGMTEFDLQVRQNEAVSKGMRLRYIDHAEGRFCAVWRK